MVTVQFFFQDFFSRFFFNVGITGKKASVGYLGERSIDHVCARTD